MLDSYYSCDYDRDSNYYRVNTDYRYILLSCSIFTNFSTEILSNIDVLYHTMSAVSVIVTIALVAIPTLQISNYHRVDQIILFRTFGISINIGVGINKMSDLFECITQL